MFRSIALSLVLPGLVAAQIADRLAFLESFFEQSGQITHPETDLINNLTNMILGELLPEINKTHATDMSLLGAHARAMGECDTGLRQSGKSALKLNMSVLGKETELNACHEKQGSLNVEFQNANESLYQFLENANPPSSAVPSITAGSSVESYVFEALGYWTGFKKIYSGMKTNLSNASEAYGDQAANCTTQSAGFKTSYCNLNEEITGAQQTFGTCRSDVEYLYNQTLLSSNSNAQGRKADYMSVLRIKCYLEVLKADKNESTGELATCKNQEFDASFLNIVAPRLPALPTAYLTSLDLPAGGPDCKATEETDDSLY